MFTVRKATENDLDGMARVLCECWHTDYRGIVPDEYLDGITAMERRGKLAPEIAAMAESGDPVFIVARDGGRVVGFVCGGAERSGNSDFDAELYRIYVDVSHRGRGAGRALLAEFVVWLRSSGHDRFLLWTFEDNKPAARFYEKTGGRRLAETKTYERAGKGLSMIAYAWDDLVALLCALGEGREGCNAENKEGNAGRRGRDGRDDP